MVNKTLLNIAIMFNSIPEAISDLKKGKMIIVTDDENRENEGDLIMSAEKVTPKKINFMAKEGRGLICTPLSQELAEKFKLDPMVKKNTDSKETNFTVSIDYKKGTTTGISVSDRAKTILALTQNSTCSNDFTRPGHVFPLVAKDGGILVRAGHTEATVDLMKLANLKAVGVICEITKDDGEMARLPDLIKFAKKYSLKIISIKDLIEFRRKHEKLIFLAAETDLEIIHGIFKIKIYKNKIDSAEHIALIKGNIKNKKDVLVRVHSECLTGEIFGSLQCDCKPQLDKALELINKKSQGVLLYLRQEGRGIGLTNKIRAYHLQNKGLDTVQANEQLGFKADLREYGLGAQILVDLGLSTIHLMTNNPRKIIGLQGYGLKVTKRISLEIKPNKQNKNYLKIKRDKLGHLLKNI